MNNHPETPPRTPLRRQHTLRSRRVTVVETKPLTPHMLRIIFGSDELAEFDSPAFDDHVKLCFPDPQTGEIILPGSGGEKKPLMREYTPRYFDATNNTLAIDFVLHDSGVATQWARQAKIGDTLGIVGPKSSFIIPTGFDWHLLIGDDSALPAIARRLEELPDNTRAIVIAEVGSSADELTLHSAAPTEIIWLHRNSATAGTADLFLHQLQGMKLPEGDGYCWAAGEYSVIKLLRDTLGRNSRINPQWLRAASYWQK